MGSPGRAASGETRETDVAAPRRPVPGFTSFNPGYFAGAGCALPGALVAGAGAAAGAFEPVAAGAATGATGFIIAGVGAGLLPP